MTERPRRGDGAIINQSASPSVSDANDSDSSDTSVSGVSE